MAPYHFPIVLADCWGPICCMVVLSKKTPPLLSQVIPPKVFKLRSDPLSLVDYNTYGLQGSTVACNIFFCAITNTTNPSFYTRLRMRSEE